MRTTLKRGLGRAADPSTNGHSSAPPVLTSVQRYRQPPPPATPSLVGQALRAVAWFLLMVGALVGALLVWRHVHGHKSLSTTAFFFVRHGTAMGIGLVAATLIGASLLALTRAIAPALAFLALVVLATSAVGGLYLYGHETLGAITAPEPRAQQPGPDLIRPLPSANSPAIALVAGYDVRAGTGASSYAGSNSDTLMLLRANPQNHTLSLLSFPRDLSVPIYCKGNTPTTTDRINSAWVICGSNGGPYAAVDTMEHLTGLHINYLITLDFHAFKQIVNRLHGVYMNVDRHYYNPPHNGSDYSAINLQPGYEKLDGGQALSYVRYRHTDSDVYRNGRQQLFMEALKQRIKSSISLSNLFLLPKLVGALKGNLQVEKAGGGPVTTDELLSYLGLIDHLPPGHLVRNAIPINDLTQFFTAAGAAELQASQQAIHGAVWRFLHPPVAAPHPAKKPGSGTPPPTKKLPHKQISVLVLNASNVAGEASNTTYLLSQQGFSTKTLPSSTLANAPAVTAPTTVYYDPVQPNAKDAAEELAPFFGSHTSVTQMTPAIAAFATQAHNPLTVVSVGTSFSGKLSVPHTTTPGRKTRSAPQVSNGIPVTLSALRRENGPAHFPLMFPAEIAAGAQLSSDEGVRLFKPLRGLQELALTFVQPNQISYWQIEQSNWTSEPILQNPTGHVVYKGRTYYIYTSAGQIQMVALRVGSSVYWVTNTILNELSNSTMIAIAESLRPLAH